MVFLVAYGTFEVPSNYFLKRVTPSKWISFLMFSWGCITIGLGGVTNFASVAAVRFLLGAFEAGRSSTYPRRQQFTLVSGLFPGLVYYLTFWYRTEERSLRVALIFASATLGGAFGGALAFGIGHMDGINGLPGWRYLFILEGVPSAAGAVFVYFLLPDFPETVSWLSEEEKALARERLRLEGSHGHGQSLTWPEAKKTLMTWRLYVHYAVGS